MALKRKLTKDEFDKLTKELQGEYEERDGDYFLAVEGEEDPDALRRARDREREEAKKLRKENKEMRAKLDEVEGSDDRKKGDIEKIDSAWKAKLEKSEAEHKAEREKLQSGIRRTMIDQAAGKLAAEISTAPDVLALHVAQRLGVDFDDDGEPSLVVFGADGKPGNTLEGLKKELLANKSFAAIMIGSKGKGGGASNSPASPGGSAGGHPSNQDVDLFDRRNLGTLMDRVKARVSQG